MSAPVQTSAVVRLAVRSYPRRWRADREAELLGVLAELVPPARTRPRWPIVVDLLRGGLATRWRLHPPLLRWLGYRLLDRRLPGTWQGWARDDITGGLWLLRRNAFVLLVFSAVFLLVPPALGRPADAIPFTAIGIGWLLGTIGVSVAAGRRLRARALERHRLEPIAAPPTAVDYSWWAPPARRHWTHLLAPVGLELSLGAPLGVWSLLRRRDGFLGGTVPLLWAMVAVGVLTLVGGFALVLRRLRSRLATVLAPSPPLARPGPWRAAAVVAGVPALEAVLVTAGWAEGQPAAWSLLAVAVGIGIGPALVLAGFVAGRAERRQGFGVSLRDLWLAVLGPADTIAREVPRWVPVTRAVAEDGWRSGHR